MYGSAEAEWALRDEIKALKKRLVQAEGDAKLLAHAYRRDSAPPEDVVERALKYAAGSVELKDMVR